MRSVIVVLLWLVPLCALANAERSPHQDVQFDPATFVEQRAALERRLSTELHYAELGAEGRAEVTDALDRIGELVAGHASLATMPADDRAAVLDAQQRINARLIRAADDSRLICRREKVIGSNLPQRVCMTVAQQRQRREAAREGRESRQSGG